VSLRDYRQTRQYTLAAGGANPPTPQNRAPRLERARHRRQMG